MTKRGLVRKVEETRGRPLKSYKILLNPTNNQLTIYNTEQSAPHKVLIFICTFKGVEFDPLFAKALPRNKEVLQ